MKEEHCTTPDTCLTCHVCQSQHHQTKDHEHTSADLVRRFRTALEQIGVWTQELEDEAQARDFGLSQWRGCVAIAKGALAGTGPDYPALEEQLLAAQHEVRRLRVVVASLSAADAAGGDVERSGHHLGATAEELAAGAPSRWRAVSWRSDPGGVTRWLLMAALGFTAHQPVRGELCSGQPCVCGRDEVDGMIAHFLNG